MEIICNQCKQLNIIGSKIAFQTALHNTLMCTEIAEQIENISGIVIPEDDYEKFRGLLYEVEFNGQLDLKTGEFEVVTIIIDDEVFIKAKDQQSFKLNPHIKHDRELIK